MSSSKRKQAHESQPSKQQKKKKVKIYSEYFRTKEHEKHFEEVVQGRKLLMERRVELQMGEALDFQIQYLNRRWKKLGTYPQPANVEVVKEFYANAMCSDEEGMRLYSYVRGRRVPYDAAVINEFLETDLGLGRERCQYRELQQAGADHDEIERTVCRPGGHYTRTRSGLPQHIKRPQLSPTAMIWMTFIHANLSPCVHVSDITEARSIILYSIMAGLSIDVGRLIADEIWQCANGPSSSYLGHPSLITHLCTLAGVDTTQGLTERPRKPIDMKYINQFCMRGAEAPPPPVMPPPPPQPRPAAAARRAATDQAAQEIGAAIIRGQVALLDCFRGLAASVRPSFVVPSLDEFLSIVAWPGDRPIFPEGEGQPDDAPGAGAGAGVEPEVREDVRAIVVIPPEAEEEVEQPAIDERGPAASDAVQDDLAAIAALAATFREEVEAEAEAEVEVVEPASEPVVEPASEPVVETVSETVEEPEIGEQSTPVVAADAGVPAPDVEAEDVSGQDRADAPATEPETTTAPTAERDSDTFEEAMEDSPVDDDGSPVP